MFISDLPRWMQANLALNSASVCIEKKMAADIVQEILTHAEKIITELEDTDLDASEKQHVKMLNAAYEKLENENHSLLSRNRGKNIIVAKKGDPTNPILNLAEGLGRITGSVANKLRDAGNKIGSLFFGGKKATKQQTFDMVVKILSLVHIDIDELAWLTREVERERKDANELKEKFEELVKESQNTDALFDQYKNESVNRIKISTDVFNELLKRASDESSRIKAIARDLVDENERLEAEIERIEHDYNIIEEQLATAKRENNELEDLETRNDYEIQDLKENVKNRDDQIEALKMQLEELKKIQSVIADEKGGSSELVKTIVRLQENYSEAQEKLNSAKEMYEQNMDAKNEEMHEKMNSAVDEVMAVRRQMRESIKRLTAQKWRNTAQASKNHKEEQERTAKLIEDAKKKAIELGGEEAKQLQEHLENMKKDLENSNKATKGAMDLKDQLEADLEKVKKDLKEAQGELQLRDDRLKNLERKRGARKDMPGFLLPEDSEIEKEPEQEKMDGVDGTFPEKSEIMRLLKNLKANTQSSNFIGQLVEQKDRSRTTFYIVKELNGSELKYQFLEGDNFPFDNGLPENFTNYFGADKLEEDYPLKSYEAYIKALKTLDNQRGNSLISNDSPSPGPGVDKFPTLYELRNAPNEGLYKKLIDDANSAMNLNGSNKLLDTNTPQYIGARELLHLLVHENEKVIPASDSNISADNANQYEKVWNKYVSFQKIKQILKSIDGPYTQNENQNGFILRKKKDALIPGLQKYISSL